MSAPRRGVVVVTAAYGPGDGHGDIFIEKKKSPYQNLDLTGKRVRVLVLVLHAAGAEGDGRRTAPGVSSTSRSHELTHKWGHPLVDLVPHARRALLLLHLPPHVDERRRVHDPLPDVCRQRAVARGVGARKLAHLGVRRLDAVVRDAGELWAGRVGIYDEHPGSG